MRAGEDQETFGEGKCPAVNVFGEMMTTYGATNK